MFRRITISISPRGSVAMLCLLMALNGSQAVAQKAPECGYVYPPAVQAGHETDVALGGYDFTPDMQFFVHDDRIELSVEGKPGEFIVPDPPYWFGEKGRQTAFPIPREIPAKIRVPQGHPPGLVRWQVANANGSSATGVVLISDSREIREDRFRNQPQNLGQLPVGVSGRLERIAEVDRYQFVSSLDGPITIELFGRQLGTNFNGVITVRDSENRLIADAADTQGLDTALTFSATKDTLYTVSLHDLDFRGNRAFVYRLVVRDGPRVVTTMPAAGQRGTTQSVRFVGYGVATGAPVPETTVRTVTFPSDPTKDTVRLNLETPLGSPAVVEIPLSDLPETVHDDSLPPGQPTVRGPAELSVPAAVTSILNAAGQAVWQWSSVSGEAWTVRACSREIGTGMDLSLKILDADGKPLGENDDQPGTPDAEVSFVAPADGMYRCVVSDVSGRTGHLLSVYRLVVQRQQPDFTLSTVQQVTVPAGGKSQLKVTAIRRGGHTAAIDIDVEGLPDGITVPDDAKIPEGKNEVKIPLAAADSVRAEATFIRITGTAGEGDSLLVRTAQAPAAGNLCPRDLSAAMVARPLFTTTLKPLFAVELKDRNRQRAVHRGTTYPAPFRIKREDGFSGEVMLQMAARQSRHRQGIRGPVLVVPADAEQALYPCFMPEWLETDRTTRMVVLGVAQQKDGQGHLRYVTRPADARVTMILEGALLSVSHEAPELTVTAGEPFRIPVRIQRSAKLQTPVTVRLSVPEELHGLVECRPPVLELPVSGDHGLLTVVTQQDSRIAGDWEFRVEASTRQDDRWPVASQTTVQVQFVDAATGDIATGEE